MKTLMGTLAVVTVQAELHVKVKNSLAI